MKPPPESVFATCATETALTKFKNLFLSFKYNPCFGSSQFIFFY